MTGQYLTYWPAFHYIVLYQLIKQKLFRTRHFIIRAACLLLLQILHSVFRCGLLTAAHQLSMRVVKFCRWVRLWNTGGGVWALFGAKCKADSVSRGV
jgi:hypothetical protein